jgi:hypothetical protein
MYFRLFRSGFGLAGALAVAAILSELPAQAVTTYQVDNRGGACVTSRVIHASESGMTSAHYAVTVYDSYARVPASYYTASINAGNYDLTLTFDSTYFPSGYCGVVKLRGIYGSSNTSASGDFEATAQGDYILVSHQGDYSRRSYGGHTFASDVDSSAGIVHGWSACAAPIYVYFAPDTFQLTFAHAYGSACFSYVTNAEVVTGSGYPAGSVPIATFYEYAYYNYVLRTSDDRPAW